MSEGNEEGELCGGSGDGVGDVVLVPETLPGGVSYFEIGAIEFGDASEGEESLGAREISSFALGNRHYEGAGPLNGGGNGGHGS